MDKKQIDEGSLVANIQDILDVITKELKSQMGKKYKRNASDGLGFINQLAKSVNMKVTDKQQAGGKLFLKLDNDLEERKQEQDPSVDDEPGTQPKKYYKGLSKKDKEARAKHFRKGSKSPAPGDSDAKTTPSKHTKKFNKMFGESDADKSLKSKADKSGISFGVLKQVFKRGVKAWQTGHRPGTTAVQWGHARVNSFITKGKGTWGGADKDLASKVESNEGLWDNIRKKKARGEPMRKKGSKGAPTADAIKRSQ